MKAPLSAPNNRSANQFDWRQMLPNRALQQQFNGSGYAAFNDRLLPGMLDQMFTAPAMPVYNSRQHQPGDVIVSDHERQIQYDDAMARARAQQQRMYQQLAEWQSAARPPDPIDYQLQQGNNGSVVIPDEWADVYQGSLDAFRQQQSGFNTGIPQDVIDSLSATSMDQAWTSPGMVHPGSSIISWRDPDTGTLHTAANPNYDPAAGRYTANVQYAPGMDTFSDRRFEGAERAVTDMINQGRAQSDPSFAVPSRHLSEAYTELNRIAQQAPQFWNSQIAGMQNAWSDFNTQQSEAQTRNQQAYDAMTARGQPGGMIPADYSTPFYGQITGQQNPWGQGFGLGAPSFAPNTPQQRDNPAAQWGGIFSQKSPWSLS